MADEVQQVSTQPESQVAEPLSQEGEHVGADPVDAQTTQDEGQGSEGHPLEPQGERFKQVWARAKEAERKAEAAALEAQREREARIRLEERAKVKEEAAEVPEKEYTWGDLRGLIAEGKLTLDQAIEYRETVIEKRAEKKAEAKINGYLKLNTREATIDETLSRYRKANPNLVKDGTPEREKLVQEYKYHVEVLGMPATRATELAAARAAFGDVDALESQAKLKAKPVEREAFMETTTNAKPAPKTKDPVAGLNEQQKEFYTKLIKAGRFGSYRPHVGITPEHWEGVRKELTWTRKG